MAREEKYEVLVPAQRLKSIPVAQSIEALRAGQIEHMTPADFEETFNIEYTESLLGNSKNLAKILKNKALLDEISHRKDIDLPDGQAVLDRLKNPFNGIAVCNMGENVGWGLFALEDIPQSAILFMYAGEVSDKTDPYSYGWAMAKADNFSGAAVSAERARGLAGFMQHLPRDNEKFLQNRVAQLRQVLNPVMLQQLELRGGLERHVKNICAPFASDEIDNIQFEQNKKRSLPHQMSV